MARPVKGRTAKAHRIVKTYDERRNQILAVAQELFYTQGYGKTSIQQIIDTVGIAKGTFYHYFRSKQELLDGVVDQLTHTGFQLLEQVVQDPSLDAPTKLHRFFDQLNNWKLANQALVTEIAKALYRDENALLRDRILRASTEMATPLLARIIAQGVAEGVFQVAYPEEAGEALLKLGQVFSESFARALLAGPLGEEERAALLRKARAYQQAMERILDAPPGSLHVLRPEQLLPWLESPPKTTEPES